MCNKNKSYCVVGLALLGCGVAFGAYLAKKHYDKRKELLKTYEIEVDRLQNEVDFDYSEDFLKELKKETLTSDKKHIGKEDVMKAVSDSKEAINEQIRRLESIITEHIKREKLEEDAPTLIVEITPEDFDLEAEQKAVEESE